MHKHIYLVIFLTALLETAFAQIPVITSVTPTAASVEQWGMFEAKIALNASYTNPYDYDQIRITVAFTAPDGETTTVEGFYMEDFLLNTNSGALTSNNAGSGFRIRFAPRKVGSWTYLVSCTTAAGTGSFPAQNFQCLPAAAAQNKGFIQAGQSPYLTFENGETYLPVGQNMGWQNNNPYIDYKRWIANLRNNGANFFRLWLCHWGLGLEWKNGLYGFGGLRQYKQTNAFYLDWLMEECIEKGVYMMLCINHHGQVSSQVNPNWSENPYSTANGGMCANTWDFFSNTAAKNAHKNRLRYILARWGYARSIMTWELFNEVNWTDNFESHRPEIASWHAEMAAFLKNNDPVRRPVSTSYGDAESEQTEVWNNIDIDYTQRHYYVSNPNLESILAAGMRENLMRFDKPVLATEFGLTTTGSGLGSLDPAGIHLHNSIWGSFFGGGLGAGMTWWWDSYVEPQNLYHRFRGISEMTRPIDWAKGRFQPVSASITGAPSDLRLVASLGWAGEADTAISISDKGIITPSEFRLGTFLYGSQWNTQYRRPPVFRVEMPQAGKFRVRTGGQLATSPKLVILLNGQKVLDIVPGANTSYEINLPTGKNTIKVDNLGTDWMQIASYSFTGLGSAIDAYLLKSFDNKRLSGWLLNKNYNHEYVRANGQPNAVSGALVQVPGLSDGSYFLKWFNCQTGALQQSESVSVQGGRLSLLVPDLTWDMAFVLEDQSVSTSGWAAALPVQIYPNPVAAGGTIFIKTDIAPDTNIKITLLNAGGIPIETAEYPEPTQDTGMEFSLNRDLPTGIYWLHVQSPDGRQMTKGIGIK
jgi:hypothetical protein